MTTVDLTNEIKKSCEEYKQLLLIREKPFPTEKEKIVQLAVNSYFLGITVGASLFGEIDVDLNEEKMKKLLKEKQEANTKE